MPKHEIGVTFKDDSGAVPLSTTVYIVDDEVNALLPVAAGAVNTPFAISFPFAKINDYAIMVGTQTPAQQAVGGYSEATGGQIEIRVDNTGTPTPDLIVQAKKAHAFAPNLQGTTNLFTADSTQWFLSNPGASPLVLVVKIGLNL